MSPKFTHNKSIRNRFRVKLKFWIIPLNYSTNFISPMIRGIFLIHFFQIFFFGNQFFWYCNFIFNFFLLSCIRVFIACEIKPLCSCAVINIFSDGTGVCRNNCANRTDCDTVAAVQTMSLTDLIRLT